MTEIVELPPKGGKTEEEIRKLQSAASARWNKKNPDKTREYSRKYMSRPEIKAKHAARMKIKYKNMTDEQREHKKMKEREYYYKKKAEREQQIIDQENLK